MALASLSDIVTTQWVKDNYLQGVDLTDDNNVPFPDSLLEDSLQSAISSVQSELDLCLDVTQVKQERHDWEPNQYYSFYPLYLRKRPLHRIDQVVWRYGTANVAEVPIPWFDIQDSAAARVHMIPSALTPALIISQIFFPFISNSGMYMPGWWSLDYTAGFRYFKGSVTIEEGESSAVVVLPLDEQVFKSTLYTVYIASKSGEAADVRMVPRVVNRSVAGFEILLPSPVTGEEGLTINWVISDMPNDLRQVIGYRASISALTQAGDLVAGAGVQSTQISVDGLLQNLTTTKAGAAGGAFAGRINGYIQQDTLLMTQLRGKWRPSGFLAV